MRLAFQREKRQFEAAALLLLAAAVFGTAYGLVAALSSPDPQPAYWTNSDFANYWVAARLVIGQKVLDLFSGHVTYFAHMRDIFGPDYDWRSWSYPPHYLLLITPLGLLDYLPAAVVFLSLTFLLFLHALWTAAPQRITWLTAALVMPGILCNLTLMQNGFLTAALLLYGLGLRERRPVLAGIAIGILTIKPQLGFLLPVLFCFERRWRVVAMAAATAAIMVALSTFLFGADSWIGYLMNTLPHQGLVMFYLEGAFVHLLPSPYGSLRSLHIEPHTALAAHLLLGTPALGFFLWTMAKLRTNEARAASTLFATFLISPYSLSYDLVALTGVVALQVQSVRNPTGSFKDRLALMDWLLIVPLCALPAVIFILGFSGLPISPLIVAGAWGRLCTPQCELRSRSA
jgi:hypothetical protein